MDYQDNGPVSSYIELTTKAQRNIYFLPAIQKFVVQEHSKKLRRKIVFSAIFEDAHPVERGRNKFLLSLDFLATFSSRKK